MATTPNMSLDKPVVSSTAGPLWATMLNAIADAIDTHDHSPTKGVKITPSGLNISSDLEFNDNDATELRSVRFTEQGALMSLAADVGCAYFYNDEFYVRDMNGNNVQVTSGGLLNAAALTSAVFSQVDKSADYTILAADTFAFLRMNATAGNRIVTLPAASAVSAGRYYIIADGNGQCSSSRTITINPAGSDTLGGAAGPFTMTIENAYGAALIIRAATDSWFVFRTDRLATTTAHGQIMLAQDLGGTAHLPTVLAVTGTGTTGYTAVRSRYLKFDATVTTPGLYQEPNGAVAGETMTIAAQASGTQGGNLNLQGGNGGSTATSGSTRIFINGTEVLAAVAAASPYVRVTAAGGFQFSETHAAPAIGQEARTTAGAGAPLTLVSQSGHTNAAGGLVEVIGGAGAGNGAGGAISMTTGAGAGTAAGGALSLAVGAAGATGVGGALSLAAGAAGSGAGGAVSVTAGAAAGNANGGDITLTGGALAGTGLGGGVLLSIGGVRTMLRARELTAGQYVLGMCAPLAAANVPVGSAVAFLGNALTAPSTTFGSDNPTGGLVFYSDAGQPAWKMSTGSTVKIGERSLPATIGAGPNSVTINNSTSCALVLDVTVNGTVYKLPLYTA